MEMKMINLQRIQRLFKIESEKGMQQLIVTIQNGTQ